MYTQDQGRMLIQKYTGYGFLVRECAYGVFGIILVIYKIFKNQ